MVGQTKHRTKADNERIGIIVNEIGCLACNIQGWPGVPCQAHHELDDGGERFDDEHRYTVGLCVWHHEGESDVRITWKQAGSTALGMTRTFGPSLARNKRDFIARYGDRDQRLMVQDSLVRMVQDARRRGEFLPAISISKAAQALHREVMR